MVKNNPNDNTADAKQYEHEAPANLVLRMYKKYALAVAMEVVVPSKAKRALDSPIPKGKSFPANFSPRVVTNPYASIPINGRGTPAKCKIITIENCFCNASGTLWLIINEWHTQ